MKQANVRRVWWPCPILQYDENGNEHTGKLMVLVQLLSVDESKRLRGAQAAALQLARDALHEPLATHGAPEEAVRNRQAEIERRLEKAEQQTTALVIGHVASWRGMVADVDGVITEVPFSTELLADLTQYADARNALAKAVREASEGARTKN